MDKVIDTFIDEASKANDYQLILHYQWIIKTTEEMNGYDIIDMLLNEKCKGN